MSTTKEKIKTVLIWLLLGGMLYLTYSVWFFDSPFDTISFEGLVGIEMSIDASDEGSGADLEAYGIRPMSVLVRDNTSCRGVIYESAGSDEIYKKLRDETAKIFGSAKEKKSSTEAAWINALSGNGVFFDYRGNVPVEALKLWLGDSFGEDIVSGRYFMLSAAEKNVNIYLKNSESGAVYIMSTGRSSDELLGIVSEISASAAHFAFESGEEDFSVISPETVIVSHRAKIPVISAYNAYATFGSTVVESCLESFRLRDASPGTYAEADGTQVYIADMVTLKVSPEGIVTYTDPRDEADETLGIGVEYDGETPTLAEKTECARSLASSLAGNLPGDGGIYLIDARKNGEAEEFIFGRHIGGVPIDMSTSTCFARISIKGGLVSTARVNLRGYDVTSQSADTLAERLVAAAVAGSGKSGDMNLRYADTGGSTVSPAWFIGGVKKTGEEEGSDELVKG